MAFFSSLLGLYIIQTIFYSLVVAFVVEALLKLWRIEYPSSQIRFRYLILVLPVALWPVPRLTSQVGLSPGRAFVDLREWLALRPWDAFPLWYPVVAVLALVSLLFLFQEVVPALRHRFPSLDSPRRIPRGQFPPLDVTLEKVSQAARIPPPQVYLVEHPEPLIYTSGVFRQGIALSLPLLKILDPEELEGVLAHEVSHLVRKDNWWSWALLVPRLFMFFNPVALVAFRRLLLDKEKASDDLAISFTGKPLPLAAGLIKVFRGFPLATPSPVAQESQKGWLGSRADSLDSYSRRIQVESRASRLLQHTRLEQPPYESLRLALTVLVLGALLSLVG